MTIAEGFIPYINYLVAIFVVVEMIMGYKKGFLYQVFSVLGVLAAILISWFFAPALAEKYEIYPAAWTPFEGTSVGDTFYQELNSLAWYVILFFGVLLLFQLIKPFAKALSKLPILGAINKILGTVVSLIPSFLVLAMVAFFISTPLVVNGADVLDQTCLGTVHTVSVNVFTLLKQPYMTMSALQKLMNGEMLSQEEVNEVWQWMMKENADPEEVRQLLIEHSDNATIPDSTTPESSQ